MNSMRLFKDKMPSIGKLNCTRTCNKLWSSMVQHNIADQTLSTCEVKGKQGSLCSPFVL